MAHPVRPAAYIEISNFYTATVYNKGAEVVRMIHTLLGPERFRAGMDLYFRRHDGQAVRTEDFVAAMSVASGVELAQFQRWYDQAGTPVVTATGEYDAAARCYHLHLSQTCAATPGQSDKLPFHIPIAVGLLGADGRDLPLRLAGETAPGATTRVLSLCERAARFTFVDVPAAPVPSLLRGFSAPVVLEHAYSEAELAHLMAHDSDAFNRWEAGQRLALRVLLDGIAAHRAGRAPVFAEAFTAACARILADAARDPALAAEALSLPGAGYIAEQLDEVDPDAILIVRSALRRHLAARLQEIWLDAYHRFDTPGPYSPEPAASGRRSLRNLALGYLVELETPAARALCQAQLDGADNMTDALAALTALANCDCPERAPALAAFQVKWQDEPLVLDKWFAVQAGSRLPQALVDVRRLLEHPAYDPRNPNKIRALVGAFCHGNHARFNAADGGGYAFAADQVIALDPRNAQVAARLARAFDRWRKFDAGRQAHARAALVRIRDTADLSKDTYEVVTRALA